MSEQIKGTEDFVNASDEFYFRNKNLKNISIIIDGVLYTERWVDIKGYEGVFQISDFGRFKSLSRNKVCSKGGLYPISEKILTQKVTYRGYLTVGLRYLGARKWVSGHRMVAIHFLDNPESKKTVNHKDFNKTNNFYQNLEWTTHKENLHHAKINGRGLSGENNGRSKLNEIKIKDIRNKYKKGVSIKNLCSEYNLSKSAIHKAATNRSWTHL